MLMNTASRRRFFAVGLALMALGWGIIDYSKTRQRVYAESSGGTGYWEAEARDNMMPGWLIHAGGCITLAFGAGLLGYGILPASDDERRSELRRRYMEAVRPDQVAGIPLNNHDENDETQSSAQA